MTSQDFSLEFDLLYNNVSSNQAPGLTEYEKSVFLTQAQEALVLDLYKGVSGDSFETTEEVTRYLSSLVKKKDANLPKSATTTIGGFYEYSLDSSEIENLMFITYQSATIEGNRDVIVVPTKQDSLFKDLNNPFRGPNKNRVLTISEDNKIVLYSKYPITKYYIKYLEKPTPIVLEDSELDIESTNTFEVDLPESLHRQILLRAVQMAKAVWQS